MVIKNMNKHSITLLLAILAPIPHSFSEEIKNLDQYIIEIKPGLWETEAEFKSTLLNETETQKEQECIKESKINPIKEFIKGQNCEIKNVNYKPTNFIEWEMICKGEKDFPDTKVKARYSVYGTTAEAYFLGSSQMPGKDIVIETFSRGKYLGECNEIN